MECQRSTGETSQKRERTVSDVIRPPCAMREGSRAQREQATKAATAEAACADEREGDIDAKAKKAIRPVEKTMMPLHTYAHKTESQFESDGKTNTGRTAMPRRPSCRMSGRLLPLS